MRVFVYTTHEQTEQPYDYPNCYVVFAGRSGLVDVRDGMGHRVALYEPGRWTRVEVAP